MARNGKSVKQKQIPHTSRQLPATGFGMTQPENEKNNSKDKGTAAARSFVTETVPQDDTTTEVARAGQAPLGRNVKRRRIEMTAKNTETPRFNASGQVDDKEKREKTQNFADGAKLCATARRDYEPLMLVTWMVLVEASRLPVTVTS